MRDFTRRSLVAAAALLAGTPAFARQTPLRTRSAASSAEGRRQLRTLARAVASMRRDGSWQQQVAIHQGAWDQHRCWRFVAWHRAQLLAIEALVRDRTGEADFAMPYWNWLDPVPDELFDLPALSMDGEALTGPRSVRRGDRIPARFVSDRFLGRLSDSVDVFLGQPASANGGRGGKGSAERYSHDSVHGFVGGDMAWIDYSPNDPIFWLHHCNIDRVWATWEAQNGPVYPSAWRQERIEGFVRPNGARVPATTAGALIDTAALGYRYDALDIVAFAVPPGVRRSVLKRVPVNVALAGGGDPGRLEGRLPRPFEMAVRHNPGRTEGNVTLAWETTARLYVTVESRHDRQRAFTVSLSEHAPESDVLWSFVFPSMTGHHGGEEVHLIDASTLLDLFAEDRGRGNRLIIRSADAFADGRAPLSILAARMVGEARLVRTSV